MGVGLVIVSGCLLGGVELCAERFFGHVLQLGIDRGVNAEAIAHRPVPANRGDDLLADVIDRVILPARVLPVADDQFFCLRASVLRVVNETKLTHSSEDEIARLARSLPIGPGREFVRAFDQARRAWRIPPASFRAPACRNNRARPLPPRRARRRNKSG